MAKKQDKRFPIDLGEIVNREFNPLQTNKIIVYRDIDIKPDDRIILRTLQFYGHNPENFVTIIELDNPKHPHNQHQLNYPNEHELTGNNNIK